MINNFLYKRSNSIYIKILLLVILIILFTIGVNHTLHLHNSRNLYVQNNLNNIKRQMILEKKRISSLHNIIITDLELISEYIEGNSNYLKFSKNDIRKRLESILQKRIHYTQIGISNFNSAIRGNAESVIYVSRDSPDIVMYNAVYSNYNAGIDFLEIKNSIMSNQFFISPLEINIFDLTNNYAEIKINYYKLINNNNDFVMIQVDFSAILMDIITFYPDYVFVFHDKNNFIVSKSINKKLDNTVLNYINPLLRELLIHINSISESKYEKIFYNNILSDRDTLVNSSLLFYNQYNEDYSLYLSCIASKNAVIKDTINYKIMPVIFNILIFLILLYVAAVIIRKFLKPIQYLTGVTHQVKNNNFPEIDLHYFYDDEIGQLARSFKYMIRRVKYSYDRFEHIVGEKTEALSKKVSELESTKKAMLNVMEDLKTEEANVLKAKDEAVRANRIKSEFLANISHDIRTPINVITGFGQLLANLVKDEKQKYYLNSIHKASNILLNLINEILDLSKIEAGMMEIKLLPMSPRQMCYEIEHIFSNEIRERKIDFIIEIEEDFPATLILDEIRVKEVLINIVGNSFKFTKSGYVKLSLKKKFIENNSKQIDVIFIIEDTGSGIPANEKKEIFESFKQLSMSNERSTGGSGLGLSISKKLIEMMNGRISLESKLGKGSVFEIYIPKVDIGSAIISAEHKSKVFENISFLKNKVLVVDDVPSNRQLLREILTNTNLEVITCDDALKVFLFAKEHKPKLIIMDIYMPQLNGDEAARILKNNKITAKIPIIALTASPKLNELKSRDKGLFAGYLSKPIEISILLKMISNFIPQKKEKRAMTLSRKWYKKIDTEINDADEIREILNVINNDIFPLAECIKGAVKISEVKEVIKKIKSFTKRKEYAILINFSNELNKDIKQYNIAHIKEHFENLEKIKERLEGKLNNV